MVEIQFEPRHLGSTLNLNLGITMSSNKSIDMDNFTDKIMASK